MALRPPGNDQREDKFRAIYMAWCSREGELPVHIEHTPANRKSAGQNLWKFPDVVSVQWDVLDTDANGRSILNPAILNVRRSLGEQPFKISSTELKVEVNSGNLRQFFFQCVSNSRWAHSAKLVIAYDVVDQAPANELRRLGASYGVSVVTFSLTAADLDQLPSSDQITSADDVERKLKRALSVKTLVTASDKDFLDWEHIKDMQGQHEDFTIIFEWISKSIADYRPHTFPHWRKEFG